MMPEHQPPWMSDREWMEWKIEFSLYTLDPIRARLFEIDPASLFPTMIPIVKTSKPMKVRVNHG
jgi:hypothetical protein